MNQNIKIGDKENITIVLQSGMKIKGVVMVASLGKINDEIVAVGYSIPNMSFNLQDGKLVENIDTPHFEGTIGQSWMEVRKPLMELVE